MIKKGDYIKGVRVYHKGKRISLDKVDGRKKNIKIYFYDGKGNRLDQAPAKIYKKDFQATLQPKMKQVDEETFINRPKWLWRFEETEVLTQLKKVRKKYKLIDLEGDWEYRRTVFGETRVVYTEDISALFTDSNYIYNVIKSYTARLRSSGLFAFYTSLHFLDENGKQLTANVSDAFPLDETDALVKWLRQMSHSIEIRENQVKYKEQKIVKVLLKISGKIPYEK